MSEHDIALKCARQVADLQDKLSRTRAGLCDLQHDAAANTMSDANGNAERAAYARFEQRIAALLAICGVVLLICLCASPAHAAGGAPNTVTLISGPNVYLDGGKEYTAFSYRVDVADLAATTAPDCSADLKLILCAKPGTRVVEWPDWYKDSRSVTLRHLPRGTTQFSIVHPGIYTSSAISYTLTVDGQTLPPASTWGAQCGANNVALVSFIARPVGLFGLFR